MAGYVFKSQSIPEELPNWVILVKQVKNRFYEVYYDPHTESWARLCAQRGRYIQILHEMGFRNPEGNAHA